MHWCGVWYQFSLLPHVQVLNHSKIHHKASTVCTIGLKADNVFVCIKSTIFPSLDLAFVIKQEIHSVSLVIASVIVHRFCSISGIL